MEGSPYGNEPSGFSPSSQLPSISLGGTSHIPVFYGSSVFRIRTGTCSNTHTHSVPAEILLRVSGRTVLGWGGVSDAPALSQAGLRSVVGRGGLFQDVVVPGGRAACPVQAADGDACWNREGRAEEHAAHVHLSREKSPQRHSDPGESPLPPVAPGEVPQEVGWPRG